MTGHCWVPMQLYSKKSRSCVNIDYGLKIVPVCQAYWSMYLIAISAISTCSGCVCDLVILLIVDGGCPKRVLHVRSMQDQDSVYDGDPIKLPQQLTTSMTLALPGHTLYCTIANILLLRCMAAHATFNIGHMAYLWCLTPTCD